MLIVYCQQVHLQVNLTQLKKVALVTIQDEPTKFLSIITNNTNTLRLVMFTALFSNNLQGRTQSTSTIDLENKTNNYNKPFMFGIFELFWTNYKRASNINKRFFPEVAGKVFLRGFLNAYVKYENVPKMYSRLYQNCQTWILNEILICKLQGWKGLDFLLRAGIGRETCIPA